MKKLPSMIWIIRWRIKVSEKWFFKIPFDLNIEMEVAME
jgi:hypothetical protein